MTSTTIKEGTSSKKKRSDYFIIIYVRISNDFCNITIVFRSLPGQVNTSSLYPINFVVDGTQGP